MLVRPHRAVLIECVGCCLRLLWPLSPLFLAVSGNHCCCGCCGRCLPLRYSLHCRCMLLVLLNMLPCVPQRPPSSLSRTHIYTRAPPGVQGQHQRALRVPQPRHLLPATTARVCHRHGAPRLNLGEGWGGKTGGRGRWEEGAWPCGLVEDGIGKQSWEQWDGRRLLLLGSACMPAQVPSLVCRCLAPPRLVSNGSPAAQ